MLALILPYKYYLYFLISLYIAIVYMSRIVPGPAGMSWAALSGTLAGKLVMIRIASKIINWITIEIISWLTIEIINCQPADSGKYKCVATNSLGSDSTDCVVIVDEAALNSANRGPL